MDCPHICLAEIRLSAQTHRNAWLRNPRSYLDARRSPCVLIKRWLLVHTMVPYNQKQLDAYWYEFAFRFNVELRIPAYSSTDY